MKIELRKIVLNLAFSEETVMFRAELYINGKQVGCAGNTGRGGPTSYHEFGEANYKIIREAEAYCKALPPIKTHGHTLPMNLEMFIDELVNTEIKRREQAKIEKKYLTKLIFGVKGSGKYTEISWGKTPLSQISLEDLQKAVDKYKTGFKNGETFWNTNLERLGVKI